MSSIENETNISCKRCREIVSPALVKMHNNPDANEWVREGYCSMSCFEQNQVQSNAPQRDVIEKSPGRFTADSAGPRPSDALDSQANEEFRGSNLLKDLSDIILRVTLLAEGSKKVSNSKIADHLRENEGISDEKTINLIIAAVKQVKVEKSKYIDEIETFFSKSKGKELDHGKIKQLLKEKGVHEELATLVIEYALISIYKKFDRIDRNNIKKSFNYKIVQFAFVFAGIGCLGIGLGGMIKWGFDIAFLLFTLTGILTLFKGFIEFGILNLNKDSKSFDSETERIKLYSQLQVSIAAFIGTPVAGSVLIARNYRLLDSPEKARPAILMGIFLTLVLFVLAFLLFDFSLAWIIPFLSVVVLQLWYNRTQSSAYNQNIEAGGQKASLFDAFGIGIGWLLIVIITLISFLAFNPPTVDEYEGASQDDIGFLGKVEKAGYNLKVLSSFYLGIDKTNLDEKLFDALSNENLEMADFLIDKGADINTKNNLEHTPLTSSADDGNIRIVNFLLQKGADINAKGYENKTALMHALLTNADVTWILLDNKADVNLKDDDGNTTLMYAVESNFDKDIRTNIVKQILEMGTEIDAEDKYDETALLKVSSEFDGANVIKLLLDYGADANAISRYGEPALMIAVEASEESVKALLERGAHVNKGYKGDTPLKRAVDRRKRESVKLLLDHNADIYIGSVYYSSLIGYAAYAGKTGIVKLLLNTGVSINDKSRGTGRTPLMEAAAGGHLETAKFLVSRGANIHIKSNKDNPALFFAAKYGHIEIANYLRGKGASIEYDLDDCLIVSVNAAGGGLLQLDLLPNLLEFKIDNGADVNKWWGWVGERERRTSLMFIAELTWMAYDPDWIVNYETDFSHLVSSKNYDNYDLPEVDDVMNEKLLEIMRKLVEKGADIDAVSDDQMTALMYALSDENIKTIKLLIELGSDLNTADKNGDTALMLAIDGGYLETTKVLIAGGAGVNARNNAGKTALGLALEKGNKKIVKVLKEAGAKK